MATELYLVTKTRPHEFPSELEAFETKEKALEWIEEQGGDTSESATYTVPVGEHEIFRGDEFNYAIFEREVR